MKVVVLLRRLIKIYSFRRSNSAIAVFASFQIRRSTLTLRNEIAPFGADSFLEEYTPFWKGTLSWKQIGSHENFENMAEKHRGVNPCTKLDMKSCLSIKDYTTLASALVSLLDSMIKLTYVNICV